MFTGIRNDIRTELNSLDLLRIIETYTLSIRMSTEKLIYFFQRVTLKIVKRTPIDFSKPIPVRLPPEMLSRVEALAKRLGEPRSTIMRMAMRIGIESLEQAILSEPKKHLPGLVYSSSSLSPEQFNEEKPKKRV